MNQTAELILSFLAGTVLGAVYFGGLWMTVRRFHEVKRPWMLILGSAALRMSVVLAGIWGVGIAVSTTGQWQRLAACLAGFVVARLVVTRAVSNGLVPKKSETM